MQQLQRFGRSGYERNVDDRVIRVDRSQLSGIGRMVIDVVVMRRWTMLVGSGVRDGMHMQLGRLQVHQREPGNQRDREHPTECRYHLLLPSYYIPGGAGRTLLDAPWRALGRERIGLFFGFCRELRIEQSIADG